MARRATLVITDSEAVRSEICDRLGIDSAKVVAIPLAPQRGFARLTPEITAEVRTRLGVEDEFLLYAGTIEPRKNLMTLVRAFEEVLRTTQLRPQLVVAGRVGWKSSELLAQLERGPLKDRVKLIGYVSDVDLSALYSSCRAFIYPSIYEGFGLPPLEAMACGAPVIASAVPSVNASVARVISPTDVYGLARSIIDLLNNPRERESLSLRGMKYAAQFSWEGTAKLTREVYDEALKIKSKQANFNKP
jgi:glycosyltransferase involved in cell wall biosynthesis